MKTTLDLPDPLMRKVKIRAASEGLKLKDLVADLLEKGLTVTAPAKLAEGDSSWYFDQKTGFPVSRALNIPGFVPPTLAESLELIERCNEEEALSHVRVSR